MLAVVYFMNNNYIRPFIDPSCYAIAIRKDGEVFRVPLDAEYGEKYPVDEFSIQSPKKPCAYRNKYFDVNGRLRPQFWALRRLL